MSEKLGRVRYKGTEQEIFGQSMGQGSYISDETSKLIDEEVKSLVEAGEQSARKLIKDNAEKFERIAQALLEFETLTGDELRDLMDGKPPVRPDDSAPSGPKVAGVPSAGKSAKKKPTPDEGGMEPQPES